MEIRLLIFIIATSIVYPVAAEEQGSVHSGFTDRILDVLRSDIYRISLGGAQIKLGNPEGFDVATKTYDTGFSESNGLFSGGGSFWTVTGESALGWDGRTKSLWTLHYDSEDFDGLKLQNLMLGAGVAVDPSVPFALGGRLAAGFGPGVTRSSSYFDRAVHLSVEAWVSAGIQLGRFTLDLTVRERKAFGATLDARSAAPSTRTSTLALGWLF